MKTNLSNLLRELAVESGELVQDPHDPLLGAEEITVVTDETKTELEEQVEDLAEKVEKIEQHDAAAEKLVEVTESLEAYVAQLHAMRAAGQPLNGPAARMYLMGITTAMEAREIPAELIAGDVMSMHHSFESGVLDDYTAEAEEKTGNWLQRVWAMLVSAVKAVKTAVVEFFTTMGKSARAIEASGKKLIRVGGTLKTLKSDKKIPIKGFNLIVSNGKVDVPASLRDAYNSGALIKSQIVDKLNHAMQPLLKALENPTPAGVAEAGKNISSTLNDVTQDLPNGGKAVFKLLDGGVRNLWRSYKFEIVPPQKSEGEVDPLSPEQIVRTGENLVLLAKAMETQSKLASEQVENSNKALSAGQKALSKVKDGTDEEKKAASEVLKAATLAVRQSSGIVPKYVSYLGSLGKQAYSFAMASASRYTSKEVKSDTAKGTEVTVAE